MIIAEKIGKNPIFQEKLAKVDTTEFSWPISYLPLLKSDFFGDISSIKSDIL